MLIVHQKRIKDAKDSTWQKNPYQVVSNFIVLGHGVIKVVFCEHIRWLSTHIDQHIKQTR